MRIYGSHDIDFSLVGVISPSVPFQLRSGPMRWSSDVNSNEIRVLGGDYGGFMAAYPPLLLALEADCTVFVCLTPTCAQKYLKGELKFDPRIEVLETEDMTEVIDYFGQDQALTLVSASQSDQGANAAVLAVSCSRNSVLAVQDLYGSLHPTLARLEDSDQLSDLDGICVTDEFSAQLMLRQFPDLADRIVVTGGPQFDKIVAVRETWNQRRKQLREVLGANDNALVFLVAGQLNGTAEILLLLEEAIEHAGVADRAKVIVRAYPRATIEDKQLVDTYFQFTPYKWFCDPDRALAPTSDDLLPGVDFVLSGYSTTNLYGILYGMPGVVYVGTPALKKDLWHEKQLERSAEVEAGAGWYVSTAAELQEVIEKLEYGPASEEIHRLRQAQERISQYNDGLATERVWQQMQNLMDR